MAVPGIVLAAAGAAAALLFMKVRDDEEKKKQRLPGPRPPGAPPVDLYPTQPEPYVWTPESSIPPLTPTVPGPAGPGYHPPYPGHGAPPQHQPTYPPMPTHAPTYPPPAPYPPPQAQAPSWPAHGAPRPGGAPVRSWRKATPVDIAKDNTSSWYKQLLQSGQPVGFHETRPVGGRLWKLMVVDATRYPQLTQRGRDVFGWVTDGPQASRPAPPPPVPHPSVAAFVPVPPQAPHHRPAPPAASPPQADPYGGGPPPTDCQHWAPATDPDVRRDGVATVMHSMLGQMDGQEKIEIHGGRMWKFKVVTPQSDPSYAFNPGTTKSVRGWVCADTQAQAAPPSADPGF